MAIFLADIKQSYILEGQAYLHLEVMVTKWNPHVQGGNNYTLLEGCVCDKKSLLFCMCMDFLKSSGGSPIKMDTFGSSKVCSYTVC